MLGLVARHIEPLAREILASMPGLVIEGARQVGKSTLAGSLVAGTSALQVSLDDASTRAAAHEDPAGFVAQAGSRTLVIDELQRLPELTFALKSAIDRDRRPGRFVLTGSASTLRVGRDADSMVGRVIRLPMFGFSQGEIRGRRDDVIARLTSVDDDTIVRFATETTRADYAQIIATGSFPGVQGMSDRLRASWLESYLDGLMSRDLADLRQVVDPARAKALVRLLAANQAGELVKARLADASSIPATTVTSYLDLLQDVGLVATLPPWTPNLTAREVGRRKALITDTGLAARLTRLGAEQLTRIDHGEAFGSHLEGFVALELMRQQTWSETDYQLFHFRDRAGLEVDFIAELGGGDVIGIEVKASTSFAGHHFTGLRAIRDRLGPRFRAGIVLNTGARGYRFADRLYGLPVSALWEL